jgi:hypothetical protein
MKASHENALALLKERDSNIVIYTNKIRLIETIIGYQKNVIEINELATPSKLHRLYQELESNTFEDGMANQISAETKQSLRRKTSRYELPPIASSENTSVESVQVETYKPKRSVHIELPRLRKKESVDNHEHLTQTRHQRSYSNTSRTSNRKQQNKPQNQIPLRSAPREHNRLRQASNTSRAVSRSSRRSIRSDSSASLSEDYTPIKQKSKRMIRFRDE